MEDEFLRKMGLSGHEATIYLELLKAGQSQAGAISRSTRINRTNVYDCLQRLSGKGLVSSFRKNRVAYFCAARPELMLQRIEEKRKELETQEKEMISLVHDLKRLGSSSNRPMRGSIELYEGKEGIKTVLQDILLTKKDVYTHASEGNFSDLLKFYFKNYLRKFEESGMKMAVIFNDDNPKKPFSWRFARTRYLPREYWSPTETTVYGDNVAIFVFSHDPRAIVIRDGLVAKAHKKHFDALWKIARAR